MRRLSSPLIQLKTKVNKEKYKELENTEEILRKIAKGNIGISAYHQDKQFVVSMGGYKKVKNEELQALLSTASMIMPPVQIASVGPVNFYFYFNPVQYSFESYAASRSVYFKTLLD